MMLIDKLKVIEKDIKVLNEKKMESKMVIEKITKLENKFEKFIAEKEEIIKKCVEKIQFLEDKCPFEHKNGDIIEENANANEETSAEIGADETFIMTIVTLEVVVRKV